MSPSYFGAVSDIRGLSEVAHAHGVPLVVDEAWGPHLGFHRLLPANALAEGADLVISSTHKLGGSLTQSAMLHLGHGVLAQQLAPVIDRVYGSMASTSTSSLLLLSLDLARRDLAVRGERAIARTLDAASGIRNAIARRGRFADVAGRIGSARSVVAVDPLRLVIGTRRGGISGHEARRILFEQHGVHMEMSTDSLVVAVLGVGTVPDPERFVRALHALPERDVGESAPLQLPAAGPAVMIVRTAYLAGSELVDASQAEGRISADSLAAYPPGIPNVLSGERLTREAVEFLRRTADSPTGYVRGAVDPELTQFRVVCARYVPSGAGGIV